MSRRAGNQAVALEQPRASLASEVVNDELTVVVHTKEPPDDAAWNRYVEQTAGLPRRDDRVVRILVYSAGGGPNAQQRSRAVAIGPAVKFRVALITRAAFPRGLATVGSWLGVDIRPYASIQELNRAAEYLGIGPKTAFDVRMALEKMARPLGITLD